MCGARVLVDMRFQRIHTRPHGDLCNAPQALHTLNTDGFASIQTTVKQCSRIILVEWLIVLSFELSCFQEETLFACVRLASGFRSDVRPF